MWNMHTSKNITVGHGAKSMAAATGTTIIDAGRPAVIETTGSSASGCPFCFSFGNAGNSKIGALEKRHSGCR